MLPTVLVQSLKNANMSKRKELNAASVAKMHAHLYDDVGCKGVY